MSAMTGKNVPALRFPGFQGDWDSIRAGDEFDFRNGLNFTRGSTGQDVKVVGVGEFQAKTDFDDTSTLSPIRIQGQLDDRDLLKENDLLFVRSNGNKALIGRCHRIGKLDERVSFSGFTIRARASGEKLSPAYSALPFRSYSYKRYLDETGGGSSISNLNQGILAGFEFRAPSILEQEKIAAFLGAVDEKINGLEKKKALLTDYKRGVVQKLLSQVLRFKDDQGRDFPDWEEKRLREVAHKTASSISASSLGASPGDYPVFGASGIVGYVDYFSSDEPYVSVVKDGAGVGRLYFCPPKSSVLGTLESISATGGNSTKFIYYWMSQINFGVYSTGSTIPHVYFKDYGKKKGRFPHPAEQRKIADFLSVIDAKIDLVARELTQAKTFKKGLLQQMFV